jgi:hypothetical protein
MPVALGTSTSTSTSKRGAAPPGDAPHAARRRRWRRLWWLVPITLAVAVFEPHSFRWLLRQAACFEAWRHGGAVQIARISGSVLEPVTFFGTHYARESGGGAVVRIEVKEATARFSWRNLFKRNSARWLERVELDGVAGKMTFPVAQPAGAERWEPRRWLPHMQLAPIPGRIEIRGLDFVFQAYDDYVRLQDARCTLSEAEPGVITAGQLVVKQPWLQRTFRELRGATWIDEAEVGIADIALEPGVKVERVAADVKELASGRLNATAQCAAFDGVLRFEASVLPSAAAAAEITGTLAGVNVAKLAAFLATPSAAGGTIKDGKFSFRGSPRRLAEATATVRIDASNFQWDARQWDSLVLGARLMGGRLEVPQLVLLQGKNRLDVDGEFSLPAAGRRWWQSAFDARIKAQIDDLTALSALLLPEFRYAAGQATIKGAIRGRDENFDGELIVNGSALQWRTAPIEELQAALTFSGSELHVSNLAIFNDGDFVRGRGRVNLRGPTQYSGVLRAAVQDLATYAALLQPPIVPEPLAGGATVTWQGEGSAQGHRGTFHAQLNKLRSRGASAALLHPINAALEGAYEPGRMTFSQFALSDDESSFTANVVVGDKGVSLREIKLRHKAALWLEGHAVLPLDVWKAWPSTSLAGMLDDTAPTSVRLTVNGLGLREASALTGWNFPIAGTVSGNLIAEGRLGALKTDGKLTLTAGRLPLGWSGRALTGVEGAVSFAEQTMRVEKFAGRTAVGDFRSEGTVDFTKLRDPALQLTLTSDRTQLSLFEQRAQCVIALAATVEGPASAAVVRGQARPLTLAIGVPELRALWTDAPRALPEPLPPVESSLAAWTLDLTCATDEPLPLEANPGRVALAGQIAGNCAQPQWMGRVEFFETTVAAAETTLSLAGSLDFRAGESRHPSLALVAAGAVHGEAFVTHFTGPLSHLLRDTRVAPPLDDAAVRAFLVGAEAGAAEERFSLQVPAILSGGAAVYDWASIP